jgi:hypothetical protein
MWSETRDEEFDFEVEKADRMIAERDRDTKELGMTMLGGYLCTITFILNF